MKKTFFVLITALITLGSNAQEINSVKWEYRVVKKSETEFELQALALIEKPWHLYGQFFEDGGPIKLVFSYQKNENYELVGKTEELTKPKVVRDEIFDIDVSYFAEKALFSQKVKIKQATEIKMTIEGQVCNDNTGMCVMVSDEHVFMMK